MINLIKQQTIILLFTCRVAAYLNICIHADSKKRRSFLAMLLAAGDAARWRHEILMLDKNKQKYYYYQYYTSLEVQS